ncbi:hypothetical protein JCM10213_002293 [Rhodosporidiobolus nylandii]
MPAPKLKCARKATRYRAREAEPEKAFDRSQSRLKGREARMETYDDVMGLGGDEDQFHHNRDKMLLEDLGGQGYGGSDDDDLEEPDEIYSLPPSISRHAPSASPSASEDEDDEPKPKKKREFKPKKGEDLTSKGRFGHEYDAKQDVVFPSSDESGSDSEDEDRGASTLPAGGAQDALAGSDDDRASNADEHGSESEDEDRWAAAQYHASRRAPGEADSEDEEAAELELEEAKRLQKKARERLAGGDFGFEEDEALEPGVEARVSLEEEEKDEEARDEEVGQMSEEQAIAHLLRTSPETLALLDDFVLTAGKIKQVEADLEVVRQGDGNGGEHPALAIMELEHQALSTYLPTLTFYFSLLLTPLSSRTSGHQQLLERVLERLSSLRQSLATMEELELTSASYGADEGESDEEGDEDEDVEVAPRGKRGMLASEALDFASMLGDEDDLGEDSDEEGDELTDSLLAGLDDEEVQDLVSGLKPGDGAEELMRLVAAKRAEKGLPLVGGGEEDGMSVDGEDSEEEEEEPQPKRAKKAAKQKTIEIPTLAPASSTSRSARPAASTAGADFLDPLALSATDAAEKAAGRKSLRFHVSQVAQKAVKREARRRVGTEGDEDAPRRSKEAARRAVLQRQQHGAAGESSRLDEGDFDAADLAAARAVRGEMGGEDDGEGGGGEDEDYYDLVAMEKSEGRKAKKARYDEERAAEKEDILTLAESSVDGPRAASRKMLANKGLTPKRKKENRNARVKKRLRYDKAQKKLGSMQAQFKGGEARTGYEGETSGISRRNVKSRKLG